jgi:hypothetical protein
MLGSAVFNDVLKKVNNQWRFVRRDRVVDPGMSLNLAAQQLKSKFEQNLAKQD